MNRRILIVEDSPTQAEQLRGFLERQGYHAPVAYDGETALRLIREQRPSIVITDIIMPRMDGYELCRHIKADETLSDTPVILLTELSSPEDIIKGLECGADNFITKPYSEDILLSRLQHILVNQELLQRSGSTTMGLDIFFAGKTHHITSERMQILGLLFSVFETALQRTQQLQISEANYRALLETSADAMLVVDRDGTVRFVNPAVGALFGRRAEDLLGEPFDLPEGTGETSEVEIVRGDGGTAVAEMRVVETRWEGESAYLASLRDITDRVRAEERLKKTLADLERSNRDLELFAYVASHDLQEPLRMVSSYVQLLARRYKGQIGTDADEFIAYAVDGAKRMQKMINDLLTYSRVGTRGKPFEPTRCKAILDQVLANLKVAIGESDAVITHDPLPTVMADDSQLIQVLQNLIDNAIKFRSDQSPRVHIGVERQDGEWLFSVRDNGIGIGPQYYERIFVIFQRLHTREEYSGTGMGLAICRKIVERHGGRIWVESESGKGSTFYFTIPVISKSVIGDY